MKLKELKKQNEELRSLVADIWEIAEKNPKYFQILYLIESFINSESA